MGKRCFTGRSGEGMLHQVGSKAPIVVYGEKDSEKILLFSGVVTDVSISTTIVFTM